MSYTWGSKNEKKTGTSTEFLPVTRDMVSTYYNTNRLSLERVELKSRFCVRA